MITVLTLALPLLAALPQAPKAKDLVRELQAKEAEVRIRACNKIEKSPVSDTKVLEALLRAKENPARSGEPQESVGYHAARALEACGAAAVPVCLAGLDERTLRSRAAQVLGQLRPVDPQTVPALRQCLAEHPADFAENSGVVIAIGALGAAGRDAVPELLATAKSNARLTSSLAGGLDGLFYGNVLLAFGKIGPDAHAAIPTLLALTGTDPKHLNATMVRRHSILSIGGIGFGPSDAPTAAETRAKILAALRQGRRDADPQVAEAANEASALLDADYDAPVAARKFGLRHKDASIRLQTCLLLGAMRGKAAAARTWIERTASEDADEKVRAAAAEALKQIGS